jgi:hypothetical protein
MLTKLAFALVIISNTGESSSLARFDTREECEIHVETLKATLRGRGYASCMPVEVPDDRGNGKRSVK